MRNGLISSGGDLALDESGRNLGTETGSRPAVPEAPDYSSCPGNNRLPAPNN